MRPGRLPIVSDRGTLRKLHLLVMEVKEWPDGSVN